MAHKVVKCLLSLPKISWVSKPDLKRILYCMACRHISSIKLNAFSQETLVKKGKVTRYSIHDVLCRINHSCSPNLHHCYDDKNVTRCITVRPIKKGDQVFGNYLGETKFIDDTSRKIDLRSHWSFDCNCDLCSQNTHTIQPDPSYDFIKLNFNENEGILSQKSDCLLKECKIYLNKYGHSWSNEIGIVISCLIFIIHNS